MSRRALCGFLLAVTIGCAGCSPGRSVPKEAREPLLMFAIGGLEWSVIQPLLADGRLPAIAGLMARGTFGYLDSMLPTFSPVIWTSIATGKRKEEHGINHFVYTERGAAAEITRYYTSGHREVKAFWNILSDYGLDVHCFGWWITYPAEPINGVMVAQTNTTAVLKNPNNALWKGSLLRGVEGQVHPRDRQNQVMSILEEVDASIKYFKENPNTFHVTGERRFLQFVRQEFAGTESLSDEQAGEVLGQRFFFGRNPCANGSKKTVRKGGTFEALRV